MPIILLLLFSFALSVGTGIVVLVIRRASRRDATVPAFPPCEPGPDCALKPCFLQRPGCWLAVRGRNVLAVKTALGLHKVKRCPWYQGLAGEEKLFISPPIGGWILVVGSGLPDPADDVDVTFRFLVGLSRKLGHVQFFSASSVLNYHAWVKAERGHVVRAYAWAGKTLWKQGPQTRAEKDLGVRCFDYTEPPEEKTFNTPDALSLNVEKVPLLAARWSLDPAKIDGRRLETECGIAGEPSRIY
jgi:hypothetical protein